MLQSPGGQELIELLELDIPRRAPPQQPGHLHQVIRPGLLPVPVAAEGINREAEMLSQPQDRLSRRRRHIIRHEPQPRRSAKLHRHPQAVARAPMRPDERCIRRSQGEEADQLLPVDLREPSQPLKLRC